MPVDASIPLSIRPVETQSPLQTLGALQNIKSAQIENALRQQQMQTNAAEQQKVQAEADQKHRDLADQNLAQEWLKDPKNATALAQWDGTSPFPLAGKVQLKTQESMQKWLNEQQRNQLTLTKEQRADNETKHGYIGQTMNGLAYNETGEKRTDSEIAALAPAAFAQLVADGHLKPENVPSVSNWDDINAFAVKNRFVEGLNSYATKAQEGVQKVKTAKAAQTLDEAHAADFNQQVATAKANLPKIQADAKIAQLDADFKAAHGGRSAEDIAKDTETARHNRSEEATAAGRLKIEQQRFGYDSSGVSPAAQMAADGRMDPVTLRSQLRSNPGLMGQILRVDPKFDEGNIDNRYNTLKEFTSTSNTKAGGQALALNTLIHHADLYMQTAEALKNGTFVPGNKIYNAVVSAFGSAPPQNAALVARFFAGETGKVATGGVPAEGEINGILKNLGTSASPEQIAGAGKTLLQIAAGRATPLMERAKQAKIDNVVQVLGTDAKEILARRGFNADMKPGGGTGKITVKAGDGSIHPFDTEAQAKSFETFVQQAGGTTSRQ